MNKEKQKKKINKKNIIIIVIILLVILFLWLIKNKDNQINKNIETINNQTINEEVKEIKFEETKELDFKKLSKEGKPIIINFGSIDCAPCQEQKPILKKLNEEGAATFRYIDVKEHPNLANGYQVELIPAQFFFYEDGTPYIPSKKVLDSGIQFNYFITESEKLIHTRHVGTLSEDQLLFIIEDMENK